MTSIELNKSNDVGGFLSIKLSKSDDVGGFPKHKGMQRRWCRGLLRIKGHARAMMSRASRAWGRAALSAGALYPKGDVRRRMWLSAIRMRMLSGPRPGCGCDLYPRLRWVTGPTEPLTLQCFSSSGLSADCFLDFLLELYSTAKDPSHLNPWNSEAGSFWCSGYLGFWGSGILGFCGSTVLRFCSSAILRLI